MSTRPNGKTKVFRKGTESITTLCINEVTGIDLTTLYYRCKNWEKRMDLDADYLFRPVDAKLKKMGRGVGKHCRKGYSKCGELLTNSCIAEVVGCGASTAATRGRKWESVLHLDLDWVFRPVDSSFSRSKQLIDLNANLKESEPEVVELSDKEKEYQSALRKHKGIKTSDKKGPFFDLIEKAKVKSKEEFKSARSYTKLQPTPSEVQY